MSINHYSSEIPETLWWTQQHQNILMEPIPNDPSSTSLPPPNSQLDHHHHFHSPMYPTTHSNISHGFNRYQNEDDEDDDDNENAQPTTTAVGAAEEEEKEAMFEKPLTPSDVGKLNRLVIPKQHAEKYFPLSGDSGESKGLLLSFEDESGKCWRFRYSYWNSSQSYVLTKGWSRYVKEKRLDAGDVVRFERHRADAQRFFILWRRRRQSGSAAAHVSNSRAAMGDSNSNNNGISMGVGRTRGFYSAHSYPAHHHRPLPYQPHHCLHAGIRRPQEVENQTTSPVGNSSRVLRLFGVNMECQPEYESGPSKPECSYLSSTQGTATHDHQFYSTHPTSYSPNSNNHTEF